jgi:diguanylate cyclase (GGDEF)-like protein
MLRMEADMDVLTGIATRRRGIEGLDRYFRLAQRQRVAMSVAIVDLDHFKMLNDRHGHVIGDIVLRRVAGLLASRFRGEDVVARWGGEEFLIGMYTMSKEGAARRLEQTLETLRREGFEAGDERVHVTFSAGVAEFPADGDDWPALYRVADAALMNAQRNGRARIVRA